MQKLYCYVDENGIETERRLFVVAVVAFEGDHHAFSTQYGEPERLSLKGRSKWRQTKYSRRLDYLRRAFVAPELRGRLCYAVFRNTQDYEAATVEAIARTIRQYAVGDYKAHIYIDALSKSKRHVYGALLRRTGIATHKVQGVMRGENNPLVRLADAVAGIAMVVRFRRVFPSTPPTFPAVAAGIILSGFDLPIFGLAIGTCVHASSLRLLPDLHHSRIPSVVASYPFSGYN